MRDIYEKIDTLADEINTTEETITAMSAQYDAIVSMKHNSSWSDDALALSKAIHEAQDQLRDMKDERDALIDLLF